MSCASKLAGLDAQRSTRSAPAHSLNLSCCYLLPALCFVLCAPARHEVYLLKLISFELSTGNNAKIIHRHHQYNQPSSLNPTPLSVSIPFSTCL